MSTYEPCRPRENETRDAESKVLPTVLLMPLLVRRCVTHHRQNNFHCNSPRPRLRSLAPRATPECQTKAPPLSAQIGHLKNNPLLLPFSLISRCGTSCPPPSTWSSSAPSCLSVHLSFSMFYLDTHTLRNVCGNFVQEQTAREPNHVPRKCPTSATLNLKP